ncbi:hypothetical protein [Massilia sp. SYSU DXS3249]
MLEPSPDLHPDYRREHVPTVKGNAPLNYIERIVQLALFFFELAEEDTNGDSRLICHQLPLPTLKWQQVQAQFRQVWYGSKALSLTEAALAFHHWICEQGGLFGNLDGVETGIREGCQPYEGAFYPVADPGRRLERSYIRMARFYRRMVREDITQHSRIAEWFVPNAVVPQNDGKPGQHPEHVVPCVVLRDLAKECFAKHQSVHDVAVLLRRLLVVIWIEPEHRDWLDFGKDNLKNRMPENWNSMSGCLYARLHDKVISFQHASGHPCTCGQSKVSATSDKDTHERTERTHAN